MDLLTILKQHLGLIKIDKIELIVLFRSLANEEELLSYYNFPMELLETSNRDYAFVKRNIDKKFSS